MSSERMTRDNAWDQLPVAELGDWTPTLHVSVIVPYYQRQAELDRTLAALRVQSYPVVLIEIIVADGGSSPPAALPVWEGGPRLTTVWHADEGYRVTAARALGAAAARGEILLFLDGDMVPHRQWIEAHARWHHLVADGLTCGFSNHVEFDGISAGDVGQAVAADGLEGLLDGRPRRTFKWIERQMAQTHDLVSRRQDLYHIVTGGNLGVRRSFYEALGGQDLGFSEWGREDVEFGFRAFVSGGLLIPERAAFCWHQGLDGAELRPRDWAAMNRMSARLANLVPDHDCRPHSSGRSYTVPAVVVVIDIGESEGAQIGQHSEQLIEQLLGGTFDDIVIYVITGHQHPARQSLIDRFKGDGRVVLSPTAQLPERFRYVPIVATFEAAARLSQLTLWRMVDALGDDGCLEVLVDGALIARLLRTRAVHRARRATGVAGAAGVAGRPVLPVTAQTLETAHSLSGVRRVVGAQVGLCAARHGVGTSLVAQATSNRVARGLHLLGQSQSPGQGIQTAMRLGGHLRAAVTHRVSGALGLSIDALPKRAPSPVQFICGNRWDMLETAGPGWTPQLTVSVVVPYYQRPDELARTLAALCRQSYPAHLTEIIVADDGSSPRATLPSTLNGRRVRVVWQEDRGFRAAAARHLGVQAASGELIVFLDGDMVPGLDWLATHAEVHHFAPDVLTLGRRTHVDFSGISAEDIGSAVADGALESLFAGREQKAPAWIERHLLRTDFLRTDADDIFRVASIGNLGIRRAFYFEIGGLDPSFTQWGGEDVELGYRAFVGGATLTPLPAAHCWHQGLDGVTLRASHGAAAAAQAVKLAPLVAHPEFRQRRAGRSYAVPMVAVRMDLGEDGAEPVIAAINELLSGSFYDLVVILVAPPRATGARRLGYLYEGDHRVRVVDPEGESAVMGALSASPLQLKISPTARLSHGAVERLLVSLGRGGRLRVTRGDKTIALIQRTRALNKAQRVHGVADDRVLGAAICSGWRVGIYERDAHPSRRIDALVQGNPALERVARVEGPAFKRQLSVIRGVRSASDIRFAAASVARLGMRLGERIVSKLGSKLVGGRLETPAPCSSTQAEDEG